MQDINKKLLRNLVIILGIFVLLFLVLFIYQKLNGRNVNYDKIEERMVNATKEYFDTVNLYPVDDFETASVSTETLINGGYLEPFEKQTNDLNCSGEVIVQNNNNFYSYMPYLKCDKYETKTILSEITKNTVTSGDGLYIDDNEYVYKGEYVNNNLSFGNTNWKIIKVTSDGYLKLIREEISREDVIWDDRYNPDIHEYYGYNILETSRMQEAINQIYDSFSEESKTHLVSYNACIGARTKGVLDFNTNEECQTKKRMPVTLPNVIDSAKASIDSHCNHTNLIACKNYNYFTSFMSTSWTMTPVKGNTYQIYTVDNSSSKIQEASSEYDIHIIIYINGNNIYLSGNGSSSKPYKIK